MFNEPEVPERQPVAHPPQAWRPAEEDEDAWERVLDCGAPGPAHAEPALFYQAVRRPMPPSAACKDRSQNARTS